MPKEYVNDLFYGVDDDGVAYGSDARTRVSWSKEAGNVQIATTAPDDWKLNPTPEGNGWFCNLDRSGLNRLIRILRQARDDAFGKDQ